MTGVILLVLVSIIFVFVAMQLRRIAELLRRTQVELHFVQSHVRRLHGWSMWSSDGSSAGVTYDLRSFDDGTNWVAVEPSVSGAFRVLGAAEDVHPGLISHLQAIDAMTKAAADGPLDPIQAKALLSAAHFDVRHPDSAPAGV